MKQIVRVQVELFSIVSQPFKNHDNNDREYRTRIQKDGKNLYLKFDCTVSSRTVEEIVGQTAISRELSFCPLPLAP